MNFWTSQRTCELRNEVRNICGQSFVKSTVMSCLFIKSTFSLEITCSITTTYQIWLTGVSISTNGNFALRGQRVFRLLLCCLQSLLSFRMPGNLNPRKGGTARSLFRARPFYQFPNETPLLETSRFCLYFWGSWILNPQFVVLNRGVQIRSETDPNSIGFRNQNIHFGSDW
jgi:hypothetical protein